MPFLTKLRVEETSPRDWVLLEDLVYKGKEDSWVIPAGTETDFATVPRLFQSLVPRTGKYTRAAIAHDWLCTEGIRQGLVTSVDADGLFRRFCRELGVGVIGRWVMWTAVRWAALFNPRRSENWLSTAHLVIPITVAVLGAFGLTVYALDWVTHWAQSGQ